MPNEVTERLACFVVNSIPDHTTVLPTPGTLTYGDLRRLLADMEIRAMRAADTPPVEPTSYSDFQQRRGRLADLVDWAVSEYDEFMKDDAYDSQCVLDKIIARLRDWQALTTRPVANTLTEGQLLSDKGEVTHLYNDLIMSVSRKYEGENRHETALRYIREREADLDLAAESLAALRPHDEAVVEGGE